MLRNTKLKEANSFMRSDLTIGEKYLAASYRKWCLENGKSKTLIQASNWAKRHIGEYDRYMRTIPFEEFIPFHMFSDKRLEKEFKIIGFVPIGEFETRPDNAYVTSKDCINGTRWIYPHHYSHGLRGKENSEGDIHEIFQTQFSGCFLSNCIRIRYPVSHNPRAERRRKSKFDELL